MQHKASLEKKGGGMLDRLHNSLRWMGPNIFQQAYINSICSAQASITAQQTTIKNGVW